MDTNQYLHIQQRNAAENGAAALAMVAAALQAPIGLREMRLLGGLDARWDLASMLGAAQRYGFQAVPLEGAYEDLPSLALPAIMVFNQNEAEHYTVLYEVDAHRALIADPASGSATVTVTREQFNARWTGDVVAVTRDPQAEQAVLEELKARKRPGARLAFGAGVAGVAVLTGLVVAGYLFEGATPALQAMRLSLAVCLGAALWSALLNKACVACNRAARLVGGLPLAPAGLAFYTILWAGALYQPAHLAVPAGLAIAAGTHTFLLGLLARHRLGCIPCVTLGVAVYLAAAAAGVGNPVGPGVGMGLIGLAAASGGGAWLLVQGARKVTRWRLTAESHELAWSVVQESRSIPEGRAHLVVYKRRGCQVCALFESIYAPALQATFGEALTIEKRDAARHAVYAPLIVILGAFPVMLSGLPPDDPLDVLHAAVAGVLQGTLPPAQAGPPLIVLAITPAIAR